MGQLDHLWAGWRSAYMESVTAGDEVESVTAGDEVESGLPPVSGSLFERILALDDEEGYIVHRGPRVSTLLNAYPYTSGHVLVLPNQAAGELDALDEPTYDALWREVRSAVAAIRGAYRCDGVNVGMNLGRAAGAGVPDHLHVHAVPRWSGDSNFMTATADTRVMPESLGTTWAKLQAAWPP
jgi:diadenosine tetraphosphate (Ap4A) HIT family hydrolase